MYQRLETGILQFGKQLIGGPFNRWYESNFERNARLQEVQGNLDIIGNHLPMDSNLWAQKCRLGIHIVALGAGYNDAHPYARQLPSVQLIHDPNQKVFYYKNVFDSRGVRRPYQDFELAELAALTESVASVRNSLDSLRLQYRLPEYPEWKLAGVKHDDEFQNPFYKAMSRELHIFGDGNVIVVTREYNPQSLTEKFTIVAPDKRSIVACHQVYQGKSYGDITANVLDTFGQELSFEASDTRVLNQVAKATQNRIIGVPQINVSTSGHLYW